MELESQTISDEIGGGGGGGEGRGRGEGVSVVMMSMELESQTISDDTPLGWLSTPHFQGHMSYPSPEGDREDVCLLVLRDTVYGSM